MYGFMEISVLEVKLYTCKITEIPPKPKIKAQIIILKEIFLIGIELICWSPLVISKNPFIIPWAKSGVILKILKIGLSNVCTKLIRYDLLKIDIITEKNTMKPPILRIVKIEFLIEEDNISPILEELLTGDLYVVLEEAMFVSLYFQNLKMIPTINEAKIWVINKTIPIVVSWKRLIPTVPRMNKGPELLVKDNKRSDSDLVRTLLLRISHTIFAPIGYPLRMPIIKGKLPCPGTLNIGLINLLKKFPRTFIIGVWLNSSVATKKGNRAGIMLLAHKYNPLLAADKLETENSTNKITKIMQAILKRFFWIENVSIFIVSP